VRPQPSQINEPIDLAKHVIVGDVALEAEAVKQRLLHHLRLAHHRPNLLRPAEENQRLAPRSSEVFQRNLRIADMRRERLNVADRRQAEWGRGLETFEEKRS
jgi:hypothetical protein